MLVGTGRPIRGAATMTVTLTETNFAETVENNDIVLVDWWAS
jgi:hypothetical protein